MYILQPRKLARVLLLLLREQSHNSRTASLLTRQDHRLWHLRQSEGRLESLREENGEPLLLLVIIRACKMLLVLSYYIIISPLFSLQIAIKILEKRSASKEVLTKFLPREINTVQRLRHPNILAVHHIVETPRQVYFMLEMAENGDLLDYINACRVLPETEARYVLRGMPLASLTATARTSYTGT